MARADTGHLASRDNAVCARSNARRELLFLELWRRHVVYEEQSVWMSLTRARRAHQRKKIWYGQKDPGVDNPRPG